MAWGIGTFIGPGSPEPRPPFRRYARRSLVGIVALLIVACGDKAGVPISISQPHDDELTCAEIDAQLTRNKQEVIDAIQKDQNIQDKNKALLIGSLLVSGWLWASADLSKSEQIKYRSLIDRNEQLVFLRGKRRC
jgi:hypothetical protein